MSWGEINSDTGNKFPLSGENKIQLIRSAEPLGFVKRFNLSGTEFIGLELIRCYLTNKKIILFFKLRTCYVLICDAQCS